MCSNAWIDMNNISQHISHEEGIASATAKKLGIDNTPDADQLINMVKLAQKLFEPLRAGLGNKPINIDVFFRCPTLNAAIPGSASTSQHMALNGAAIDLNNTGFANGPSNEEIFNYIKDHLEFDQLINEYDFSWIHVSYNENKNRNEILTSQNVNGKIVYEEYKS